MQVRQNLSNSPRARIQAAEMSHLRDVCGVKKINNQVMRLCMEGLHVL